MGRIVKKNSKQIFSMLVLAFLLLTSIFSKRVVAYAESSENSYQKSMEEEVTAEAETEEEIAEDEVTEQYDAMSVKSNAMSVQQNISNGKKDILLIQSVYPWNSKCNKSILQSIGVKFDIVTAEKALTMDLIKYRVVVLANDQTTDVYDNIAKL